MSSRDLRLNKRNYNVLQSLAQYVLPISGAFYFLLSLVTEVPYETQVLGIILIVAAILGIVLGYASRSKYDGIIEIDEFPDGRKRYSLNLESDPSDLDDQKDVVFRVQIN